MTLGEEGRVVAARGRRDDTGKTAWPVLLGLDRVRNRVLAHGDGKVAFRVHGAEVFTASCS
jgi:hypothetical protein